MQEQLLKTIPDPGDPGELLHVRDIAARAVTPAVLYETYDTIVRAKASSSAEPAQLALRILLTLQTTLCVEHLIGLFSREIRGHIPHDSISYGNEEQGLDLCYGETSRYSLIYRLIVEEQLLGHLTLSRQRPFEEAETTLLEYLLGSLVYPLRNALDHRRVMEDARRDPLTRIYNRLTFETLLRREIGLARRHSIPLSLAMMDLDRFKSINDEHGHAAGDQAIRTFVACVTANIRDTDVLARYGGDEFVLILGNTTLDGAQRVAERIRRGLESHDCQLSNGARLRLTSSIGLAELAPGDDLKSLCERADRALALAKRNGRNRVAF